MIPDGWGPIAWPLILVAAISFALGGFFGGFFKKAGADLWDTMRRRVSPPTPPPIVVIKAWSDALREHPDIAPSLPADLKVLRFEHREEVRPLEARGFRVFRTTEGRSVETRDGLVLMWRPEAGTEGGGAS